jgi:probable F420-dependent oxidoreductase
VKFGLAFAQVNPSLWAELAVEADRLGFESLWLADHLVLPEQMSGSPMTGHDSPPIPSTTPTYDALAYLTFLAARTERIRLGTYVYALALRPPFVAARAIQTVELLSAGRLLLGVGAGWLREEWDAAGVDFGTRGARLDEAIEVCRRLWTEPVVEHHGTHFSFGPVRFEPKPTAPPRLLIGGETPAALRRAAGNDGWMGMGHTPDSVRAVVEQLGELRAAAGSADRPFEVTIGGQVNDPDDVEQWERAGVDRLIISPWRSTRDAIESCRAFAARFGLPANGAG